MGNDECGIREAVFATPLGWTGVSVSDKGILHMVLPKASKKAVERELTSSGKQRRTGGPQVGCSGKQAAKLLSRAVALLKSYFAGKQVRFDLPLDLRGHTEFQQEVWHACSRIPWGSTRSYGWLAERVGRPKAARAVGQAMGANPIPVLVP